MALSDHFVTLAGSQKWDDEIRKLEIERGHSIVQVQEDQHRRGRAEATLVETMTRWSIRYLSGLYNRAIIFGGRSESPLTKEQAIQKGIDWVNQDPENRSLSVPAPLVRGTPWETEALRFR